MYTYEVRPRKNKRGVDLTSHALPFGRLWYGGPGAASNAVSYAMHYSRSHDAVIRAAESIYFLISQPENKNDLSGMGVNSTSVRRCCDPSNIRI